MFYVEDEITHLRSVISQLLGKDDFLLSYLGINSFTTNDPVDSEASSVSPYQSELNIITIKIGSSYNIGMSYADAVVSKLIALTKLLCLPLCLPSFKVNSFE